MCVSWCHVQSQSTLYYNHEDCDPHWCEFAGKPRGPCENCRHRQGELCGLTRATLPEAGGCCHWNVELTSGSQRVTMATLEMLGPGSNETIRDVLNGFDVAYRIDDRGDVWVDVDELRLPDIYGVGTNREGW